MIRTVADLRRALEAYPDDAFVTFGTKPGDWPPLKLTPVYMGQAIVLSQDDRGPDHE